jgi:hypothetical protein
MKWYRIEIGTRCDMEVDGTCEASYDEIKDQCEEELREYIKTFFANADEDDVVDVKDYVDQFCRAHGLPDEVFEIVLSEEDSVMYISEQFLKEKGYTEEDLYSDKLIDITSEVEDNLY